MSQASNWTPKPWLAFLLGLIVQPAGLLYSGAPRWALSYFTALIVVLLFYLITLRGSVSWALFVLALPIVCAAHSYRLAKRFKPVPNRPAFSKLHVIAVIYVAVIGIYGLFNVFLYQPFRIVNKGMTPTIPPDSLAVLRKWGYGHYQAFGHTIIQAKVTLSLQRGDVIKFIYATGDEKTPYVSRLIGLPGDTIGYHDKVLSINGVIAVQQSEGEYLDKALFFLKIFRESIGNKVYLVAYGDPAQLAVQNQAALDFSHKEYCQYDSSGLTCKVPEHNYFVLSDNRDNSMDSRIRGFVSEENIFGVVSYVLQQNAPIKLKGAAN